MKKIIFVFLISAPIISSMEKPIPKNKYLVQQEDTNGCDEKSAWLQVPRLTFMAMMLQAHANNELDKKPFAELLTKTRKSKIAFDEEQDAYCLTEKEFFTGLLAYVPVTGPAHDCVIPTRFNVILHGIATQFTLGQNFGTPNNIKALAIEELSPSKRDKLIDEYYAILKSVSFKE